MTKHYFHPVICNHTQTKKTKTLQQFCTSLYVGTWCALWHNSLGQLLIAHRRPCHVDAVVKWNSSHDHFLPQFRKSVEPGDPSCNHYDGLQQSTDECHHGHIPGIATFIVLVACALCHVDALPYGGISRPLEAHPGMGED